MLLKLPVCLEVLKQLQRPDACCRSSTICKTCDVNGTKILSNAFD